MARSYNLTGNATNTASATLPLMTVISTSSLNPAVVALEMGSADSPADNAVNYGFQRCTTTGTVGSSVTPQPLNPQSPAAGTTSGLAVFSAGPTLTANAWILQWSQNMRQAYRWQAYDLSKALILPGVTAYGIALMSRAVTPAAFNCIWSVTFEE